MLREGESSQLLRLGTYSFVACALAWFGYQRFVVTYEAEVESRRELRDSCLGRPGEPTVSSRKAQLEGRLTHAEAERAWFDGELSRVRSVADKLPRVSQIGPVVQMLHKLATSCGCVLASARAEQEIADRLNPDLVRMRFAVSLKGRYPQLRSFLTRLEQGDSAPGDPVRVPSVSFNLSDGGAAVSGEFHLELLGRSQ